MKLLLISLLFLSLQGQSIFDTITDAIDETVDAIDSDIGDRITETINTINETVSTVTDIETEVSSYFGTTNGRDDCFNTNTWTASDGSSVRIT